MIELSNTDQFHGTTKTPAPTSVEEYLAMGYTQGTASQLAHLSTHLLRDIGVGR